MRECRGLQALLPGLRLVLGVLSNRRSGKTPLGYENECKEANLMRRTSVRDALNSAAAVDHILVKGWVRLVDCDNIY